MPHTPGPWTATNSGFAELVYAGCDQTLGSGHRIAEMIGPNGEANARLIAAAPELLQALKELLATSQCIDSMNKKFTQVMAYTTAPELHQKCREAIAKATGTET